MRRLVRGLDHEAIRGPSELSTDATCTHDLAYNPEHHSKTKHIEQRHYFVPDMVEKFEMIVPLVGIANNADFFAKALKAKQFFSTRDKIMNIKPEFSSSRPWLRLQCTQAAAISPFIARSSVCNGE